MKDTLVKEYLDKSDWRVNENSNVNFSIGGLILYLSGAVSSDYWLKQVYTPEIAEAHKSCALHLHDLSFLGPYCAGWSLRQLIQDGLSGVEGKTASAPAKHLSTLCNQMVNFLGIMQNEWAGAQAFSSFDTYLAPFVKKDDLSDEQIKQALQSFVFGINIPSRWGSQAPFSNVTFDVICPDDLKNKKAIVGGEEQDFTYGDCQDEITRLNKIYIDIFLKGDKNGRGFQYPIPTYNLTEDFDWDSEVAHKLFAMSAKYGTPYFSNFINSDMKPEDVRSMCVTGDTRVKAKVNGVTKEYTIEDLLNNNKLEDINILTSQGYRPLERKLILDYKGFLYTVKTTKGKVLRTTEDHPHLVYDENGKLKVVQAKDLKEGMIFSCKPESFFKKYNLTRKNKTFEELYGKEKADELRLLKREQGKKRTGEKNSMFGKHQSNSTKLEISKKLKGHYVTENCRNKSSERWTGFNNPVANEHYWHKNVFSKKNFSKVEFDFEEELNALGVDCIHQKVFNDKKTGKTFVADFFIPIKNLIIELESKCKDTKLELNKCGCMNVDKFNYYRDNGFDVLVMNANNKNYRSFINSCEEIESIDVSYYEGKVYDVEIKNEKDRYKVNDFYANDILTHNCCRLRLDKRELRKRGGGLFGSDEFTGSIGVVTINLPQIAFLSKTKDEFKERLDKMMNIAKDSLELKRKALVKLMDMGLYPYSKRYLSSFNNHFNTIGICGMNEACKNFIGKDLVTDEGQKMANDILSYMRERMKDFQEETGNLYNLEASPAESTSYRLALHDTKNFKGIITAGTKDNPYYTNSSQLPVDFTSDIFDAMDLQDELQCKYTGGTVFHCHLGEQLKDWETCRDLVKSIVYNYKMPYITMSPIYSICPIHGYLSGNRPECPICKREKEDKIRKEIRELKEQLDE